MRPRRLAFVAAALGFAGLGVFVACGGGDSGESGLPSTKTVQTAVAASPTPGSGATALPAGTPYPASTGGTTGGPEPVLPKPAAYFSLLESDIEPNVYKVNPTETFIVTSARFALLGQFTSGLFATSVIQDWGYVEGWQAAFDPQNQLSDVLTGKHYLRVETYLFATADGASKAYDSFISQYNRTPNSQPENVKQLGNASAAYTITVGNVGRSDLPNVYHRFLWRRGNMVAIVQVNGAEQYVSANLARDYAVIIDDKALGKRPAPLPTAIPTVQVAVPTTVP